MLGKAACNIDTNIYNVSRFPTYKTNYPKRKGYEQEVHRQEHLEKKNEKMLNLTGK